MTLLLDQDAAGTLAGTAGRMTPSLTDDGLKKLGPDSPDATTEWYSVAGVGSRTRLRLDVHLRRRGCIALTSGGCWRANINLPDGSALTQVDLGLHNTATSTTTTAYVYT